MMDVQDMHCPFPNGTNMTGWNWKDDQDMGPPIHLLGKPVIFDGDPGIGFSDTDIIKASIQVCSSRSNYDPGHDRDYPKKGYSCEFLYLGFSTRPKGGGTITPPPPPTARGRH